MAGKIELAGYLLFILNSRMKKSDHYGFEDGMDVGTKCAGLDI